MDPKVATARPVYLIGGRRYLIYLYHGLIARQVGPIVARELDQHMNWYVVVLVGGLLAYTLSFSVGLIAFALFEKPFMGVRRATPLRAL